MIVYMINWQLHFNATEEHYHRMHDKIHIMVAKVSYDCETEICFVRFR